MITSFSNQELFEQENVGVNISWTPSVTKAHTRILKAYTSKIVVVIGLGDRELELRGMSVLMM